LISVFGEDCVYIEQRDIGWVTDICRSTKPLAELGCIVIFQFVPWDQLGQLDAAVVAR
jgi:hypothetical protein